MRALTLYAFAVVALIVLASCRHTDNRSELEFYGADSQTAKLSFTGSVEFQSPVLLKDDKKVAAAKAAIEAQVEFLFGSLKEHTGSTEDGLIDFSKNPGVPSTHHVISLKDVTVGPGAGKEYRYTAQYDFVDTVAFSRNFLKKGKRELKLLLPKNPKTIYAFGNVGDSNKCSDEHYNSEGDFWYFWNPYKKDCPAALKQESILISALIDPVPNTKKTFPEYARMEADKVVDIAYLVSPDEDKANEMDEGRAAFEKTFLILQQGRDLLKQENPFILVGMEKYLKGIKAAQDVRFKVEKDEPFEKILTTTRAGILYRITMKLIDSNREFEAFKVAYKEALKTADVVVYDGHSGLGWNLDLERYYEAGEASLPKDKYQIYFFNACSTYAYYNHKYFARKITDSDTKGTKNLDVATTSIGALFHVAAATDAVFMLSLVNGSRPSWQKIMDAVYDVDPDSSALTQVNGDEDNPVN